MALTLNLSTTGTHRAAELIALNIEVRGCFTSIPFHTQHAEIRFK
jgi:hypothetical protein